MTTANPRTPAPTSGIGPQMRNFMLQAYLNRELDAETEAEFELELLADPELAELAASDTALWIGLNPKSQADLSAQPATEPSAVLKPSSWRARRWSRSGFVYAAAASVLMLLSGVLGYVLKPVSALQGGAQLAYIDKQRSGGDVIQVQLPKVGPLVLMVPVASATPCLADIAITQSNRILQAQAQADDYGYAVVVMAFDALSVGTAQVRVQCQGTDLGTYEVQVIAP